MSKNSNKCIIFSAPSGAGKTTIVRYLLEQELNLAFSVSACSRPARGDENHGKDYYFLNVQDFKNKINEDAFIEWEEVYKDMFYGTLKEEIERIWSLGKTVIFDVDVEGGINLKKQFKSTALSIFVNPPSIEVLNERLRFRSTDSEEKIQTRLAKAKQEIQKSKEFDIVLNNFNLDEACENAKKIVIDFLSQ